MSRTPTEEAHDVVWREVNWNAEVRKIWGEKWNKPEVAYVFSSGRTFELRTEDAGIYNIEEAE